MKIEHLILSRDSLIEKEKNTLSIIEFIEDISIKSGLKPTVIPFHLVAVFRREKEVGDKTIECKLVVLNPAGREIVKIDLPTKIEAKHRRFRLRVNGTFPVDSSGDYVFRISGKEIGSAEAIIGINFEFIEGKGSS